MSESGWEVITEEEVKTLRDELSLANKDCMTLALRLYSEDESTFAPESWEVMKRWKPRVEKVWGTPDWIGKVQSFGSD